MVTFDGSTWSTPVSAFPGVDGFAHLHISCASSSFCMLMGSSSWVMYDGHSWSPMAEVPSGSDGSATSVNSVWCASTSFCVAVSGPDALTYDGTGWSPAVDIDSLGVGVYGTLKWSRVLPPPSVPQSMVPATSLLTMGANGPLPWKLASPQS